MGRVLVVDDVDANRRLIANRADPRRVCPGLRDGRARRDRAGDPRSARSGADACDDAGFDGTDGRRAIKHQPATRLVPVVLIAALQNSGDRIRGIEAGADDFISKPFNAHELSARVRSLIRIKRYTDDLDTAETVIVSLALTIEARDQYTDGHCQRLASYASALGRQLGLTDEDITALARGGFLHDIGKIGVPDAILLKPARLTPAEYAVMKQHAAIGERLCGGLRSLRLVRPIVRHHHERLDGSGYPDGLRGDAIPLLAQIIGIVDVFDAITTARPYKAAAPAERGFEELAVEAARGWHRRDLVDAFAQLGRQSQLLRHHADGLPGRSA